MYKAAYKYNYEVVFYFDSAGNKYAATGGSLAWRINNPGLVHSHTHFSRRLGSIASFGPYAIFSHPQEGRKGKEDTYLIGNNVVLSKKEAIEWIQSHRLDGGSFMA